MLADLALLRFMCQNVVVVSVTAERDGSCVLQCRNASSNMMPVHSAHRLVNSKDGSWPTQGEGIPPIHTALCRRRERCAAEENQGGGGCVVTYAREKYRQ